MSDELSEESSKTHLADLTVQSQQALNVLGSSTNLENYCVSSKNPEQNLNLTDKRQFSTVDPQEGPSKLRKTEDFCSREAESKMEVIEKEISAEEKKSFHSAMAKQINTEIIKFKKYPTPLDKFPDMDEVYSVTNEALDRLIYTIKNEAKVLQKHEEILNTASLKRSNMSSKIIQLIQSLKAKTEQIHRHAMKVQIVFKSLAEECIHKEAKEVYIEFSSRLNDLANIANLRKLFVMDMAGICRGHAAKLKEFSQKLSEMADIHVAHAEIFHKVKSIFQKYEDLCIARAESLS